MSRYTEPRPLGGDSYRPLFAPHLQPGERIHAVAEVRLSDLIRRVPRKYRPGDATTGAMAAVAALSELVAAVAELLIEAVFGLVRVIRRIARGRGLQGGWESQAGRFVVMVRHGYRGARPMDNDRVFAAFTDRRILLADHLVGAGLRPLGDLPYGRIRRVEDRTGGISDRVDLHFADGSLAALSQTPDEARALVALIR
ncbi:hypothetical protein ACIRBX_37025 [Kitasatospora sp. NPDC096147]|uniref:hypothetical protein n=1 Tax=Kitasatospora sp. NPDC096147 TaxID=3364093 RepID=UPI00380804C9